MSSGYSAQPASQSERAAAWFAAGFLANEQAKRGRVKKG
jgi:hypothetical protein